VQVAIVHTDLRWLPAAVKEWSMSPGRRHGDGRHTPLRSLFRPPVDVARIHGLLSRLLVAALQAYTDAECKGTGLDMSPRSQ
jgi:hypothetical protein